MEGFVKEVHGDRDKGEMLANQARDWMARKRSQKFYKLIGMGPFALTLMMPLSAAKDYRRRMGSEIG